MKKIIFLLFLASSIFESCSLTEKKNEKTAEEFYTVYAERNDINKLIDFYSDDPELVDAVPQLLTRGKSVIKELYSSFWNDTLYKRHPDYPQAVTIKGILSNDTLAVVSGQYNPYFYNGNLVKEMQFNTWLYFDKNGKIKKQVEWTQFPMEELEQIINYKKSTINIE